LAETEIRLATIDDAARVSRLHVVAWRESYAELFPEQALLAMDAREHEPQWRESIAAQESDAAHATFLVEGESEGMLGFASCGPQRVERLGAAGFAGEFWAIYLLRRAQGRGFGRALMRAMARHLLAHGFMSASVWVFRDNPGARRFYEALGGKETGAAGDWTVLGVTLADMSYGWRDLEMLTTDRKSS
jgi:L-amino acid N-acyltransferase YncA